MKLFAYSLRPYDELKYLNHMSQELGFEFGWTDQYPSDENLELAHGFDAVSIITNPMGKERLCRLHDMGVRWLATRSIGSEHIDVTSAHALGMRVAHAVYDPEGVANYSIMLMLMAARKIKLIDRLQQAQDFDLEGKIGLDISSATVGVVGTGRIGATVCRHLQGFGCTLLAADPDHREDLAQVVEYVELPELFSRADIITLHAPGTKENFHLLDEAAFAQMKHGVIVVNAARGSLIDTQALIGALEIGQVGAAALDTIEGESGLYYHDLSRSCIAHRERAILEAFPQVILTPHMAFYTEDDVRQMVESSTSALLAFSQGNDAPNEIQ